MSKKWIYEGEFRMPKPGEHFLLNGLVQLVPQVIGVMREFPIVRPIPDDVVMVPREKIEALRKLRDDVSINGLKFSYTREALEENRIAQHNIIEYILDCAEPAKPKDEILEALIQARLKLMGTNWRQMDAAIALREKELKERGE